MRVKHLVNKKECLECFYTEVNILTECRHPNVVKILDASFDGNLVKEQLIKPYDFNSPAKASEAICTLCQKEQDEQNVKSQQRQERGDLFGDYGEQAYDDE